MAVKVREWKGAWWLKIDYKGKRVARRCASKKAAEKARDEIDAKLKLGQAEVLQATPPLSAPVPTFSEYADRWLTAAEAMRLRPQTVEQYRTRLKLRILPALGALPLASITREMMRNLIAEMARGRNYRTPGQPVARKTILETLRTVSAILSTAEEDGVIAANPCRRMGKYLTQTGAGEAQEIEVFTRDELRGVLEVAERDWPEWYPFLLCLARTGMRLGEAMALEWRDVDLGDRVILVRRSRRRRRVSEPKNGKARRVDLSARLAEVLQGLRTLQEAEAIVNAQPSPVEVFSAPRGTPIDEVGFRARVWTPLLKQAGLRYRKPHTLRHTYASLLIEAGEPLTYIQRQLGHHSAAFTLTVYGHLLPRGDRRAVDALDDATIRNPRATVPAGDGLSA